jgi:geranylgeranyl pyrophosphate synthase
VTIGALRSYGLNLGIAFQIRDDTLDLVGRSEELGKPVECDLARGKMSLATIYALRASSEAADILAAADGSAVSGLLRNSGALSYALGKSEEYAASAKCALDALPPSAARDALGAMADFAVDRIQ